jgi:hypothetical protein
MLSLVVVFVVVVVLMLVFWGFCCCCCVVVIVLVLLLLYCGCAAAVVFIVVVVVVVVVVVLFSDASTALTAVGLKNYAMTGSGRLPIVINCCWCDSQMSACIVFSALRRYVHLCECSKSIICLLRFNCERNHLFSSL